MKGVLNNKKYLIEMCFRNLMIIGPGQHATNRGSQEYVPHKCICLYT